MTATPDPQIVNELALEVANIALHDAVHVDQWISAVVNSRFGNECSQFRAPLHTAVARRMAVAKPSWPDEQPQEFECEVCTKPITAYPCVLCEHEPEPSGSHERFVDPMVAFRKGRQDEQPQNKRDGYAVRLFDMLEADPDRFQESEEEDLRAALSALFQYTAEAANLTTALAEAQAERDGAAQAVADAVTILEGMLNEDAWAYDAGRARGVLLDYFARDLDALDTRNARAGEQQ